MEPLAGPRDGPLTGDGPEVEQVVVVEPFHPQRLPKGCQIIGFSDELARKNRGCSRLGMPE
jgi:hypothetical protein